MHNFIQRQEVSVFRGTLHIGTFNSAWFWEVKNEWWALILLEGGQPFMCPLDRVRAHRVLPELVSSRA